MASSTPRKRVSTTPRGSLSQTAASAAGKGIPVLISLMSGSRNLGSRSATVHAATTFEDLLFQAANITTFTSVKVNGQVKSGTASVASVLESVGGPSAIPAPTVTFQLPSNVKECTCIGCPNLLVRLKSRRACDTCHSQGRNLIFAQVLRLIVPASTNFRTPPTESMRRAIAAKAASASSPSAVSTPITGAEALALLASFTHWKFDGSRDVAPNARSSSVSAASLSQLMVGDPNEQILYAVFPSAAEADTMMHEATKLGFNDPPNNGPVRLSRISGDNGGHVKLRMISHYWKLEIATPSGNALKECLFAKLGKQNQTRQRAKAAKNSDASSTGSSQGSGPKAKSPAAAKRAAPVKAEPKVESPNSTSYDGSSGASYSPLQPTVQSFTEAPSHSTSNNSFVFAASASSAFGASNMMDSHFQPSHFQQQFPSSVHSSAPHQQSFISSTGLSQADHNALSLSLSNHMPVQAPQLLLPTPDPYGVTLSSQPSYAAVWSQEAYLKPNQPPSSAPSLLQYGSGTQPLQLQLPDYHPSPAADQPLTYSSALPPLPPLPAHYSQQRSSLFTEQPPALSYAATRGDLLSLPAHHSRGDSTDEASSVSGGSSGHTPTTVSGHLGPIDFPGSAAIMSGLDGDGILKVPAPFFQSVMSQQSEGVRAFLTFESTGTGREAMAPSSQSIPLFFMYPQSRPADPQPVGSVSQYSPADSSVASPHQHPTNPSVLPYQHQQYDQQQQQLQVQQQPQLPSHPPLVAARSSFPPPLPLPLPLPSHPQQPHPLLQHQQPSLSQPQSYSMTMSQPRQMMAAAMPTPSTPLSVTNLTPIAPPDPVGPGVAGAVPSRRRPRDQEFADSSTMPQIGSLGSAAFVQNPYSSAFFGYSPQSSPNTDLALKRVRTDGTTASMPHDYSPRMPNPFRPGVFPENYLPVDPHDVAHTDGAVGYPQNPFANQQGNVVKIPVKPSERPEGITEAQMKEVLKKERWWRFSSFSHNPVLLAIEVVLAALTIGVLIYIGAKNAAHNRRDISGITSIDDEEAGAGNYGLLVPFYNPVRLDMRAKMVEQNARDLAATFKYSSYVFDNVVALSNVSFSQEPFRNDFIRYSAYSQATSTASAVGQLAQRLEYFAENYDFINTTVAFEKWSKQMCFTLQSEPLKALVATLCRTPEWQAASFGPPLTELNTLNYDSVCNAARRLPPGDFSWLTPPPTSESPVIEQGPAPSAEDEPPPASPLYPPSNSPSGPAVSHVVREQIDPVFNSTNACAQGMLILVKFFGFSSWNSRFRPVRHPEEFVNRLRVAAVDLRQQAVVLNGKATALGIMNREAPHSIYLASRDWELRGSMLVPLLFGAYGLHLLLVFLSWIVYNAWRYCRAKCCPPEPKKSQPRVFFYTPAPRTIPPPPPGPPPTGLEPMPLVGRPSVSDGSVTEMQRLEVLPPLPLSPSQPVGEGAPGESAEHLV